MKKLYYFPPAAMTALVAFLCFLSREFVIWPFAVLALPLFLSSFLLYKGKIWGAVLGIADGLAIIIDDLSDSGPGPSAVGIGIAIIIFYLICGLFELRTKMKTNKK